MPSPFYECPVVPSDVTSKCRRQMEWLQATSQQRRTELSVSRFNCRHSVSYLCVLELATLARSRTSCCVPDSFWEKSHKRAQWKCGVQVEWTIALQLCCLWLGVVGRLECSENSLRDVSKTGHLTATPEDSRVHHTDTNQKDRSKLCFLDR